DAAGSTFGDTSVSATVPNPDQVAAFAAERSYDGALTVMVINKNLSGSESIMVNLANSISDGSADVWQLTSANAITQLSAVAVSGGNFSATVPAQSITLYLVSAGVAAPQATHVLLTTGQAMPATTDRATRKPEDREPGALALNDSVN